MSNFDDMKLAVEALSGGKNTVLFDDIGMPSIMVVLPQMIRERRRPFTPALFWTEWKRKRWLCRSITTSL